MTWVVFYVDEAGEWSSEQYADWTAARDALRDIIEAMNPKNTELTFQRELAQAEPNRAFHATDGVYSFAIETI